MLQSPGKGFEVPSRGRAPFSTRPPSLSLSLPIVSMVLSHKKLKQQLRSLVSDSLTATAAGDVNDQLQSIKQILASKPHKPRSTKRPKRIKEPPLEETDDTQKKREMNPAEDEEKERKMQQKKIYLKKRKKAIKLRREKWKNLKERKKAKKLEKGNVSVNQETSKKDVAESIKIDESEEDPNKVYVGGIPYYSSEDDIRSFFEACGSITELDCMTFPESGKFRGIAMLTFKTEAAAKRAIALDGGDMGGFYLKIQPYKATRAQKSDFTPEIVDGYNRIYIGNLSWDVTEDDLKKLFSECKISSIRFGTEKETGEFKGYAHVDFLDSVSLEIALKLDQEEVCGRPVKIRCAVPSKAALKKVGDGAVDGSSKNKRRPCYQCGVWGHLAAACLHKSSVEVDGAKGVETGFSLKPPSKKVEDGTGAWNAKKKKQAMETGLSLKPPSEKVEDVRGVGNAKKKQAMETGLSSEPAAEKAEDGTGAGNGKKKRQGVETSLILEPSVEKGEGGKGAGSTKKKRRTCYVCGVPGHISSDCPTKQTGEVAGSSAIS